MSWVNEKVKSKKDFFVKWFSRGFGTAFTKPFKDDLDQVTNLAMEDNAVEFGEWLRTFDVLTKEHGYWILDCQISTKELYDHFLKDKSKS